ncbi:hypothetical protein ILUMI_13220 [Ignelater luminosus]|uniref:Uncharacterized protein n=1 Tax=Ignelater luminosus TaxID=2038154 RepID=A0A8K0CUX3_IGNLU|nr:hypothetical protein ILUMI_13220 [Ignelater luminosus]
MKPPYDSRRYGKRKFPSGLIRRGELLEVWHNKSDKEKRIDALHAYIVQKLKLHDCTETVKDILRKKKHTPTTAKAVGRPAKRYSESSDVTKRRRIHTLLDKSAEELSFAAQMTLRAQGLRTVAEMVKRVSECSENAQQLKKAK